MNAEVNYGPVFPCYLDQGSEGESVDVAINYFQGTRFDKMTQITPEQGAEMRELALQLIPDGKYTKNGHLAKFVSYFQKAVAGIEADGNLGPGTRKALMDYFEVDFDSILGADHLETKFFAPSGVYLHTPGKIPILLHQNYNDNGQMIIDEASPPNLRKAG